MSSVTELSLDYESASEADLKSVGLHNYMTHSSTRPLMAAWRWNNNETVEQVDFTDGEKFPPEVVDALADPHVHKWAFNAAFERYFTRKVMRIKTPTHGWRCSMALAFMRSFSGGLEQVGAQLGFPAHEVKDPIGIKLVKLFSMPQRTTKKQPLRWRDRNSDPFSWGEFLHYNRQDVIAEGKIKDYLIRFPILDVEWELYEMDQIINDRGLPVDIEFVRNGRDLAVRRKGELMEMMRTAARFGEDQNPASNKQILPWLVERGYPFGDLQKATVKKVLAENEDGDEPGFLADDAVSVLKLRQQANRTSVKKLDAILHRVDERDHRLRHCFQFAGAQRTNRWSGRGPQPQNLVRTPKMLESREKGNWSVLLAVTEAIRKGDYDTLHMLVDEPMGAIAGAMRSSFRAPEGYEFVVCDLSAIESAVIAWLSGCERLLNVFRTGKDPYKDFGTELYQKPYDQITKDERGICKPPTLGCGFGLGGGLLRNGKKTGLWGYAEGMGVEITKEEAKRQVDLFRQVYPEIPAFWKQLEDGCRAVVDRGKEIRVNGHLTLTMRSNFLTMQLPSERLMFYHKPRVIEREFAKHDGGTYKKKTFTCMGKMQGTNKWTRINVGGPKMCENAVQATAREVLALGMRRAHNYGFKLVGSVHDELIALRCKGDNYFTLDVLKECMIEPVPWLAGLPLNAAGYVSELYKKD
jgi:DNA polymerase